MSSAFYKTIGCHLKSDFRLLWQEAHFSNKNPIYNSAKNNRRIVMTDVFYFVHTVERVKNITRWHKTLSTSAISKQVSRRSIKFLHEFTVEHGQSVTMVRKVKSNCLPCLNVCIRGQFEIKILIVWLINTTYFLSILKKIELDSGIIWKLVTCQRITSKNTRPRWVNTWALNMVRWYWSPDTLFWQLSVYHNMNVQYQVAPGLPNYM